MTFIESTFNGNTTNKPSNKLQMIEERKPISSLLWLSISPSFSLVRVLFADLYHLLSFCPCSLNNRGKNRCLLGLKSSPYSPNNRGKE